MQLAKTLATSTTPAITLIPEGSKAEKNLQTLEKIMAEARAADSQIVEGTDTETLWESDELTTPYLAYALSFKSREVIQALVLQVTEITLDQLSLPSHDPVKEQRVFLRFMKQYLLSTPTVQAQTQKSVLSVIE